MGQNPTDDLPLHSQNRRLVDRRGGGKIRYRSAQEQDLRPSYPGVEGRVQRVDFQDRSGSRFGESLEASIRNVADAGLSPKVFRALPECQAPEQQFPGWSRDSQGSPGAGTIIIEQDEGHQSVPPGVVGSRTEAGSCSRSRFKSGARSVVETRVMSPDCTTTSPFTPNVTTVLPSV